METRPIAGTVAELLALLYDGLGDLSFVVEEPLLNALDYLLALELKPEVLSENSLSMALSIYKEAKRCVNHVLVNDADLRGKPVSLGESAFISGLVDLSCDPERLLEVKLNAEHGLAPLLIVVAQDVSALAHAVSRLEGQL